MYLKKLAFILVITLVASFLVGILFDHLYKKRWATLYFEKTDELIKKKTYYDLVYFGNSRVHFGINPFYVDSATGLSSYNFGIGGGDAEEMMLTGNLYLKKHPRPRMTIMAIDLNAFGKNTIIESRFHYMFYLDEDSIYQHIKRFYPTTPVMKLLRFTKYSFFDEYNRTSLFVKGKALPVFEHNICRGFVNIHQGLNNSVLPVFNNMVKDTISLAKESKGYLINVIANFIKAGTSVVIISSPEKSTSPGNSKKAQVLRDSLVADLTKGLNVTQFNFRNSPVLNDGYFTDDTHLNYPGAKIFSRQLADSLKTIL